MAIKAKCQITLSSVVDVKATYRYYLLQSSTLEKPSKPNTFPPDSAWDDVEPTYNADDTNNLYFVDCSVFCDDTFQYSDVSLSSSYEAAKAAYNKATTAQDSATSAQSAADNAQSTADSAEENIGEAVSRIEILENGISMLVTDGSGASMMEQTANGWTFNLNGLQAAIDAASESLGELTNTVEGVGGTVGTLQEVVGHLEGIAEYIKIGTYEGEPCIELGESDSNFKLIITNTRILFMEETSTPAYMTNQSLFIKKAVIEEEMQQGQFVWQTRANGNLGLVWKGGNG